jgi:hypothetical protein
MARIDQVLSFHRVAGRKYELSGLRTGSVRDQILRGHLLVERLFASKEIDASQPLLVIGGGAAGVTCALTACGFGVDVTVLELNVDPLQTQAGVTTRCLDPTEFDWPQPHWTAADMAWAGTPFALRYVADHADALAQLWTQAVRDVLTGVTPLPGQLEIFWGVDARKLLYPDFGHAIGVQPWPGQPGGVRSYGAAISCIGFSGERTSVPSTAGGELVGPLFWSADTLALPGLGIAPPLANARALVSGGGDGAQQDFQRILTGKFGKDLANDLGIAQQTAALPLADALLAEDLGRRAHAWGEPGVAPAGAYADWHASFVRLADAIWQDWAAKGLCTGLANTVLRPSVEATWLVGAEAPGYCYGLNRLLALLVARLHAHRTGRPLEGRDSAGDIPLNQVILYGYWLESVTPQTAHACGNSCFGLPHLAGVRGAVTGPHQLGPVDAVIVRHGVDQQPLFTWAPVSEQLVPFNVPV